MSEFTCIALKIQQPAAAFYIASVKARDLESICRPLQKGTQSGLFTRDPEQRAALSEKELDALVGALDSAQFKRTGIEAISDTKELPYQRFLEEKRSVQIAEYLKQPGALLPNSIILAINGNLEVDGVLSKDSENTFRIKLPRDYTSAVILDGQHRVAAFRYLSEEIANNYEVAVSFLIGIPFHQQAEIFATINGKQKSVNRSIIYDLFGYSPLSNGKEEKLYDGMMAVARFCSHVARILNSARESPWRGAIKMRGPGDLGIISQAAVVDYLSALVEPKRYTERLKVFPVLYRFFKEGDPVRCSALIIVYLSAIKAAQPTSWDDKGSLFWKNNGVAVIFKLFHDELIIAKEPEAFLEGFRAVYKRWRNAPPKHINEPPKVGGGGIQNQLYDDFFAQIFNDTEKSQLISYRNEVRDDKRKVLGLIRPITLASEP